MTMLKRRFTHVEIEALLWAWEITWRQPTADDEKNREVLRKMIPILHRPAKEVM
jgi:hypothetical protein